MTASPPPENAKIAYFSMEIALHPEIPTYSGGLGVLSGDTIRSAADLGLPMVAVTLAHRKGYFRQNLDAFGNQSERPSAWRPEDRLEEMEGSVQIVIEQRHVHVRAWRLTVTGVGGHSVPVYLLDTDCPENDAWDRTLTDSLYGGDRRYRLCQEVLLGIGGVRILRRLGHSNISIFHMNEGHAALLALALLEERIGSSDLGSAKERDIEEVRRQCVFTTHTPVPAGHDQFTRDLLRGVLGAERAAALDVTHCCPDNQLNMTFLGLRFSHYINGVAMRHGDISRDMFPAYPVRAITNGVHAVTWTSPPFRELYDVHIPEWRRDNAYLRYVIGVSTDDIGRAHAKAKAVMLDRVQALAGIALRADVLTIGFARRAAAYKRFDLIFTDTSRLRDLSDRIGPLQIVFSGKAHPQDELGKAQIRRVFEEAAHLNSERLKILYLEDYGIPLASVLTSGVDLWLNTPQQPYEASGTSGMKAALNGVPSLSILDGWWIEGCIEGATGWSIGKSGDVSGPARDEAASLYSKLAQIMGVFYQRPIRYQEVMRTAIAINGSFFHTQRMVEQYMANAYFPAEPIPITPPAKESFTS